MREYIKPSKIIEATQQDIGSIESIELLERHYLFRQLISPLSLTGPIPCLASLDVCVSGVEYVEYVHEPSSIPSFVAQQLRSLSLTMIRSYPNLGDNQNRFGLDIRISVFQKDQPNDWLLRFVNFCRRLKRFLSIFHNYYLAQRSLVWALASHCHILNTWEYQAVCSASAVRQSRRDLRCPVITLPDPKIDQPHSYKSRADLFQRTPFTTPLTFWCERLERTSLKRFMEDAKQ